MTSLYLPDDGKSLIDYITNRRIVIEIIHLQICKHFL